MSTRPCCLFLGTILAAAGFFSSAASAQTKVIKEVNARPIGTSNGVDLYRQYCAVCHGNDGKGNGPAASALKAQPTDLTVLTRTHNGKFPAIEMTEYIKGDRAVAAHGTPEMPMWGDILKSVSSSRTQAEMRVNSLVAYLEQIQR